MTADRRIHYFDDSAAFARALSRAAGLGAARVGVHRFPDGESLVRIRRPPGRHAWLVRSLHDPNGKILEVLMAADALRRAGARRVTLVAPYLPYMRQDAVFRPGEAVSQQVVCGMLADAFDGLRTLEPHLHRVSDLGGYFPGRSSISSVPLLAACVSGGRGRTLVVGPDEESEPWVRAVGRRARCPWVVGNKKRMGDRSVEVRLPDLPGCDRALIVDDIASSGVTIAQTARALARAGVRRVEAAVVHAIFAPHALAEIRRAGVRRIRSSDTIPHPTNAMRSAPLFARSLGVRR